MRVRAAAILLALLTAGPALAEDRPRQRVGKVTLRVTQVFPETHQALVYDKATNKHVVVTEGEQLGKYEIVEVGDDELIVRVSGRELVLPAEQPATPTTPAAPAKPADPGLLDPYAPSTPAPPSTAAPTGPGPLDPYAGIAPTPAEIRVVVAPEAQRAGGSAAPLDPYAPIATPATPAKPPAVAKPDPKPPVVAKPDATPAAPTPPATPAVEAIRLESMTLKRGELASALGDFDSLHKAIGFVRTGTGVRLTTIAPGSYFHGMGLRSGDVVTAINNAPLRTLDDAAAAYARLGSAKKLDLAVVRAGERGTLHFALK
ncbi:MAG: hypothetical protein JNK64_17380 [Myxococcales bacterium]|nr:hypothetical protein [Myxococcales bacterium]